MIKNAAIQDPEMNLRKEETDRKAGELLRIDYDKVLADAEKLSKLIKGLSSDIPRVVVAGGAGAGKTSISVRLAEALRVKHLDMDKYIPGGFTEDKDEYARRLNRGLYEMWEDIPPKGGWVIDHIEASSKEVVGLLSPNFAILCDPGIEHIRRVAEARKMMGGDTSDRTARGLQSAAKSLKQFSALPWESVPTSVPGYHLKVLTDS